MLNLKKTIFICFILVFTINNIAFCTKKSRDIPRYRSCLSNIRVIQGAVEMYNMDHQTPMEDIYEDSIKTLVKEKYLKSPLQGPETSCKYTVNKKLFSENGVVYCEYHGGVDKEKIKPSAKFIEILENHEKWEINRQESKKRSEILFITCVSIVIICILITIIKYLLLPLKKLRKENMRIES